MHRKRCIRTKKHDASNVPIRCFNESTITKPTFLLDFIVRLVPELKVNLVGIHEFFALRNKLREAVKYYAFIFRRYFPWRQRVLWLLRHVCFKSREVDSVVTLARRNPVKVSEASKILGDDDLLIHWEKPARNKKSSYTQKTGKDYQKPFHFDKLKSQLIKLDFVLLLSILLPYCLM